MRARERLALAVIVPALVLGAVACGGSHTGTETSPAQLRTMEAKWRTGLFEWRKTMLRALDGLSLVFATDGSVGELSLRGSQASTRLTVFEGGLSTCSAKVFLLGPVPARFEQARVYALEACRHLSDGIGKVNQVVADLRHGFAVDPIDPLGNATVLLAAGQTELSTAVHALDEPSA